eukprot:130299-Pelagomonas_calceolata.AAC.1
MRGQWHGGGEPTFSEQPIDMQVGALFVGGNRVQATQAEGCYRSGEEKVLLALRRTGAGGSE